LQDKQERKESNQENKESKQGMPGCTQEVEAQKHELNFDRETLDYPWPS
jgi:hypothetical protein